MFFLSHNQISVFLSTLTDFAAGFGLFLFARMLVGIGEAAYGAITPSLIADYFRPAQRNRVRSFVSFTSVLESGARK